MNVLYLVCDGGGTKTDFLLFDKTGRVRGRAQGAGANANFAPPQQKRRTPSMRALWNVWRRRACRSAQVRELCCLSPGFARRCRS
ncbi:MAG: hypothetical protein V8T36_06435 [Ruthenibacterium lactatiformans]